MDELHDVAQQVRRGVGVVAVLAAAAEDDVDDEAPPGEVQRLEALHAAVGRLHPVAALRLVVTAEVNPDGPAGPEPERRRTLIEVEPHRLEIIALVVRVHITADATRFCLQRGIGVAWFAWDGGYLGRLAPEMPRSADLRLRQYETAYDPARRLRRARAVVAAKLANAREVLRDIQSNEADAPSLADAIARLKEMVDQVESGGSAGVPPASREDAAQDESGRLLGLEGAGAHTYFQALGNAFRADIPFTGRQRRPPPDPANALLSFGYVLLGNLLAGLIEARGLDPALGFFHEVRPGRPSLALDLLEELRHPLVDRFVLRACNLRILRPEHFEADAERPGGVRLTRDGLRLFFREWEKHLLRPLREQESDAKIEPTALLRRQVERLAVSLRGGEPYQPFRYGG
ncbi:MAG: CRISPR-associated endonuclease Cas1 [Candidatus Tectomicrobia bacterium]|nr:CRISPR-associated endonuclease Cas1 [Candidatus Tectomicrobia bacterium]